MTWIQKHNFKKNKKKPTGSIAERERERERERDRERERERETPFFVE